MTSVSVPVTYKSETMVASSFYQRTTCRACSAGSMRRFLQLGPMPLANSFLSSPAEFTNEEAYPLDVYFCEECSLVQLADVVNPEILFGNYIYVTGTANTIVSHNRQYAKTVYDFLSLGDDDLVIEVASNNGSLLGCFRELGLKNSCVEPAQNIAAMANAAGDRNDQRLL